MAKYSFEFKKKVVKSYLNGEGGYTYLANKYGIPSDSKVKLWIDNYNAFGDEGLTRSRKSLTLRGHLIYYTPPFFLKCRM